jgi:hypothetical protein
MKHLRGAGTPDRAATMRERAVKSRLNTMVYITTLIETCLGTVKAAKEGAAHARYNCFTPVTFAVFEVFAVGSPCPALIATMSLSAETRAGLGFGESCERRRKHQRSNVYAGVAEFTGTVV